MIRRRRRPDPSSMHVLITGAASGIGAAVARRLGGLGAHLYLTDLHPEPLAAIKAELMAEGGDVVLARPADVSDLDDVRGLAEEVHRHVDALDAVMNVAGIATWGRVENLRPEHWRGVVEVNLMGPIHVIESFVPQMVRAERGGHLVNVSSAAGLIGLPWHAPYSAAKFGLRGVSEVLRFDLKRNGIAVSLVVPGGVDTPLTGTLTVAGVDTSDPAFQKFVERFRRRAVTPDQAAAAIVRGMLERRYLVYTSGDIRLIHAIQRYVPPVYELVMSVANRQADRVAEQVR